MSHWLMVFTAPLSAPRARQVRLHLAMVPLYAYLVFAWSSYAIDNATSGPLDRSGHLKGHDFAHFYVLGQIGLARDTEALYDIASQNERLDRIAPGLNLRFFPVHSPQVALFFAPFARLSYHAALAVWLVTSIGVYVASCLALISSAPSLRPHRVLALTACLGSPAFYSLVAAGQTSALALAWLTLGYLALRHRRAWMAGMAFGALSYKPTLGLILALVCLLDRDWRLLLGAAMTAAAQYAVAWAWFGPAALGAYAANWGAVAASVDLLQQNPWLMHSLWPLFFLALPACALPAYVLSSTAVAILAITTWRSPGSLELRYSVLLLATALVDPHVYAYELVVVIPVFIFATAWSVRRGIHSRTLVLLLYACGFLPALDGLTRFTGIQWSVLAMVGLMILLARGAAAQPALDERVPA